MPPTSTTASFIALQCFQCSTMQVKQHKKSSNKWTCAVCNEKQSVRKVYAQGSVAKDVRLFVQSFNMSRMFTDEEEEIIIADTSSGSGNGRKRRTDWTEYLDPHDKEEEEEDKDTDVEGEIVRATMFKKAKLKNQNPSTIIRFQQSNKGGKEELLIPPFPQKNINQHSTNALEDTPTVKTAKMKFSRWSEYLTEEENEDDTMSASMEKPGVDTAPAEISPGHTNNHHPTPNALDNTPAVKKVAKMKISKWSEYLTEEEKEEDTMSASMEKSGFDTLPAEMVPPRHVEVSQMLEEEIHPEFLM